MPQKAQPTSQPPAPEFLQLKFCHIARCRCFLDWMKAKPAYNASPDKQQFPIFGQRPKFIGHNQFQFVYLVADFPILGSTVSW